MFEQKIRQKERGKNLGLVQQSEMIKKKGKRNSSNFRTLLARSVHIDYTESTFVFHEYSATPQAFT